MLGQWLEDCCDQAPGRATLWDTTANLFENWTEYAVKAGEKPGSTKAFSKSLIRRGFERYRVPHDGRRGFKFVRVKANEGDR